MFNSIHWRKQSLNSSRKIILTAITSALVCTLLVSCNGIRRISSNGRASNAPWPQVAFHRKTISDGFLLMFDKPPVKKSDGVKVTVLGIGRVDPPQIKLVDVPNYTVDHRQRMVVLLKTECSTSLISNISYATMQDFNETQRGDWRSNTYAGAGHIEIPGIS
jgi:hypothetical protein